jgi:hypothetical protein
MAHSLHDFPQTQQWLRLITWVTVVVLLACSSMGFHCYPPIRQSGFSYWEIADPVVHCVHGLEVRPWVAKSGKDGVGVVVRFDAVDETPRTIDVEMGQLVIWRDRQDGENLTRTAMADDVETTTIDGSGSLYLPFEFDNETAWHEGLRQGSLRINLSVDDRLVRMRLPIVHQQADRWETYHPPDFEEGRSYRGQVWDLEEDDESTQRTGPHISRENEYLRRDIEGEGPLRVRVEVPWTGGCGGANDE